MTKMLSPLVWRVVIRAQTLILLFAAAFPPFVAAQSDPQFPDTPDKFEMKKFKRTTSKPAIITSAFTREEFERLAPDRMIRGADGKTRVKITKRTKYKQVETKTEHLVLLDDYVAELNKYETFLNQYGETLRDGKLNKENPNDTQINSDLGVLFALAKRGSDAPKVPGGNGGRIENVFKIPIGKPNVILYDPDKFGNFIPYDPTGILRPVGGVRVNPAERVRNPVNAGIRIAQPNLNLRDFSHNRGFSRVRLADGLVREMGFGLETSHGGHVLQFKSGTAPGAGCQQKSADYDGYPVLGANSAGCKGGAAANNKVDEEVANLCPDDIPQAGDPTCLYDGEIGRYEADGSFVPKTFDLAHLGFDSNGGGNGWFGGYAYFDLLATVHQRDKIITLTNAGIGGVGMELIGSKIDLLTAHNYTNFKTGMSAPQRDIKATALPGLLNIDLQTDFSKEIKGPGTMFLIGPVPISITSSFLAELKIKKDSPPFVNFPDSCLNAGGGSVQMKLGPYAKGSVYLRAAVDAFIASAGIEGELILTRDEFGATLTTEIAPQANKITFKPELYHDFTHLAGTISLFIELDLIFYSKKWSTEIISFDGFTKKGTLLPKQPLVIGSKKKK